MIEVRCHHALREAAGHRAAINALNLASARPDPFSTFEFYEHCVRNAEAYPDGSALRPWLLLAFCGGDLVGYLALKEGHHRVLGWRVMRLDLLTSYVGDRPHLVARPEFAQRVSRAVWAYLLGRQHEWSLLEFTQQDDASALLPPPPAAATGACRLRQWPNMAIGIIELPWQDLAGYHAALSHKARSNVGRQMRALFAAGDVQLLTSDEPQGAAVLFELYRSIEPHSWKGAADVAVGRTAQSIDLCLGLLDPRQPMRTVVQVLLLGGVPVAGLVSATFDQGFYALHIVYDEGRGALSLGSAMLLLGIRQAQAGGCSFVNLLWGSGHYKTRWLAHMHETCSVQVYRKGTPYHWRRRLGDLWRRCVGAPRAEAPLLFNPVRRAVVGLVKPAGTDRRTDVNPDGQAARREAAACLIERAHALQVQCLTKQQLAAAMPFATSPAQLRPVAETRAVRLEAA
jgi:Acetyltransferase (GNAT) domain